jgi:hypothetical protein
MVVILHPFHPIREVAQISFLHWETKGQLGLSITHPIAWIILRALGVLKPGSARGGLTQIINLTPSLCINLLQWQQMETGCRNLAVPLVFLVGVQLKWGGMVMKGQNEVFIPVISLLVMDLCCSWSTPHEQPWHEAELFPKDLQLPLRLQAEVVKFHRNWNSFFPKKKE